MINTTMNDMIYHIRNGFPVYTGNGLEMVRPNICNRNFALYVEDSQDVQLCAEYLSGLCCRSFGKGQMEHVMESLVYVGYIRNPADVVSTVLALRNAGVRGAISCYVEYVDGYLCFVKNYKGDVRNDS